MSGLIVTEAAMRPNAPGERRCFYCGQPVGSEHRQSCVTVVRKARIRMTIEYDVEVPSDWGKDLVEFQRNEGSWCADNALGELEAIAEEDGCLCDRAKFECVEIYGDKTLRESG